MSKQLRLASAALTDVGRKRERNQDNVITHVPPDADLLEEKGGLFVVCDGMGGHAAGEVASDLGVRTIRDVYFAQRGQDVITSIAQAVKSANETIFTTARSTIEYGGMGTTCVALVVAAGRGYVINIGDSRAYILRNGVMRQVTQDHSWVAEQVRNGILSEEQARVHAHRNVITRSLGTQPSITADLFVETLHDGDRVLLCSDGLHGYVEEDAVKQELITQPSPDVAARNLIAMANANGGPDNISAVIVDILESPEVTEPVPLPPNVTTPIEEGSTQPLPAVTSVPVTTQARPAVAAAAAETPPAAEQTAGAGEKPKKRRTGVIVLRVLEAAAVLLIAFSVWYAGFGPLAAQRQATQHIQTDLARAHGVVVASASQNPVEALQALSSARTKLLTDMRNPALDASTRVQAQTFLDNELTSAVQATLRKYDLAAGITHVSLASALSYTVSCAAPGQASTPVATLSTLTPFPTPAGKPPIIAGKQFFYAISNGTLEQILIGVDAQGAPQAGQISCAPATLAGVQSVVAIAMNGDALDVLAHGSAGYSVISVTPQGLNPDGSPKLKAQPVFNVPVKTETPGVMVATGSTYYLSFHAGATGPYGVWTFHLPAAPTKTTTTPSTPTLQPSQTVALPQATQSLVAMNHALYVALTDGSFGQIDAAGAYHQLSVLAPPPVVTTDPSTYTAATPVPTAAADVTPSPSVLTAPSFGAGSTLAGDPLAPMQMLLTDTSAHRIVRLTANTSGPGAGLSGQYVYEASVPNLTSLALTGSGSTLTVYAWDGANLLSFPLAEPSA